MSYFPADRDVYATSAQQELYCKMDDAEVKEPPATGTICTTCVRIDSWTDFDAGYPARMLQIQFEFFDFAVQTRQAHFEAFGGFAFVEPLAEDVGVGEGLADYRENWK